MAESGGRFTDYSLRTEAVNQGPPRWCCGRNPWVVLAGRNTIAVAQTNNGLGDAWQGNRNRGGTPQQVVSVKPARHSQIISTHAPPFPPAGNDQRCSQPAPDAVPASCKASERIASR